MLLASTVARAQDPLRVLDHMPHKAASPTSVITVTFDRPVAGTLEHTVDPSRVVHLTPELRVRVEWRDPSTVRIVPLEPLLPGLHYDVTVDTGFAAIDGSRLAAPEHIRIDVRGPALIGSVPALSNNARRPLDPTGKVLLAFSAPVADSVLAATVRLMPRADHPCAMAHAIAYHVVRQRRPQKGDPYQMGYRPWELDVDNDEDSVRFARVAELTPDEPVPENCLADLAVPSLDSMDSPSVLYPVSTARPFGRIGIGCGENCATATTVGVNFDAPVAPEKLVASVHFEPADAFKPVSSLPSKLSSVVARSASASARFEPVDAVRTCSSMRSSVMRRLRPAVTPVPTKSLPNCSVGRSLSSVRCRL